MKRIPELDGLRGVAILMVLAYHYGGWEWGWTGVDLFFVLSGFLIGGILMDNKSATNYYSVFYTRRAYRILPLYAVTIAMLPLLLATHYEWFTVGNKIPWYAYATFTQNFWMVKLEKLGTMALAVSWSLAIEEQFYLTLPIIVRNVSRSTLIRICCYGIALAPVLRIGVGLWHPHNWIALWALMPMRMDALLLGVLAAWIVRSEHMLTKLRAHNGRAIFILTCGVAMLYRFTPTVDNPIMQSFGYTWIAFFYACVLLQVVTFDSYSAKMLRAKWLGYIGGLAYGIYLLHEIVLGLVFGFTGQGEPTIDWYHAPLIVICAILTIGLADLSFKCLEQPMLKRGARSKYHEMDTVLDVVGQSVAGSIVLQEQTQSH
jgi:peptidoglycan/LPS O-acetylase OafA/YrhL